MDLNNDIVPSSATDHCAAHALCPKPPPLPASVQDGWKCAGCGNLVHTSCTYLRTSEGRSLMTCYLCFDRFGRVITGQSDPIFFIQTEVAVDSEIA